MGSSDLAHLVAILIPAAIVTLVAAVAAPRLIRGTSVRWRLVAVAAVSASVALANLAVVGLQMSVSSHDATVVVVLLLYALGAGTAVALSLARPITQSVGQLENAAAAIGKGDLEARVGRIGGAAELDTLAQTLDQMAMRLQQAQRRERDVEQVRRDLITAVSHDLRTPLAALRAMVEAIDEGIVEDPPSLRRYAVEMRRSIEQLSDMVDDLFELSQLDAGAIERETRRARLDEVVRSALAGVEVEASRKRLALVTDLGTAGDAGCSPRVGRVLHNLLVNAVRHTPADGTVSLSARKDGNRLELAVQDTGEGISAEDLPNVFDPFFRVDPSRSGPGAGLGLAVAKRIVEALGGRISAQSSPSIGSRFAIELPLD
jgi:signal transduction histidine kinase